MHEITAYESKSSPKSFGKSALLTLLCVLAVACTMRNEALRDVTGALQNVTEALRIVTDATDLLRNVTKPL